MKRAILLMAMVLILSAESNAQLTPETISREFFSRLQKDGADKAINQLFSYSPYQEEIRDGLNNLKRKLNDLIDQVGGYRGTDTFAIRTIGPNLRYYAYLARYDRQPIIIHIMYYKPSDKWVLQNFSFKELELKDLEESTKPYLLKENFTFRNN